MWTCKIQAVFWEPGGEKKFKIKFWSCCRGLLLWNFSLIFQLFNTSLITVWDQLNGDYNVLYEETYK